MDVFRGLNTYNEQWSYNSSIFSIIYVILDKLVPWMTKELFYVKAVCGLLYLLFLGYLARNKAKSPLALVHRCFLAIAVLFLINPVGDPWYFCWVLPFLCVFPYRSWYLLSGLLVFSYINFQTEVSFVGVRWLGIPIVSWIVYVPFFCYLFYESIKKPYFLQNK